MKLCQICKKKLKKIINFGNYPVSHKFNNGKFKTEKFPLILGQCKGCGLVQLIKFTPIKKLTPKDAQTGPAKRSDAETIKKHLNLLSETQQELYLKITQSIQNHGKEL